jgi:hypothetical protein
MGRAEQTSSADRRLRDHMTANRGTTPSSCPLEVGTVPVLGTVDRRPTFRVAGARYKQPGFGRASPRPAGVAGATAGISLGSIAQHSLPRRTSGLLSGSAGTSLFECQFRPSRPRLLAPIRSIFRGAKRGANSDRHSTA